MKKIVWLFVVLSLFVLTACGGDSQHDAAQGTESFVSMMSAEVSPMSSVASTTVTADMTMDWAEREFPELFPRETVVYFPNIEYEGVIYNVRAYVGLWETNYLGITEDRRIFGLGAFTGGVLTQFETIDYWAAQIIASGGSGNSNWSVVNASDHGDGSGTMTAIRNRSEYAYQPVNWDGLSDIDISVEVRADTNFSYAEYIVFRFLPASWLTDSSSASGESDVRLVQFGYADGQSGMKVHTAINGIVNGVNPTVGNWYKYSFAYTHVTKTLNVTYSDLSGNVVFSQSYANVNFNFNNSNRILGFFSTGMDSNYGNPSETISFRNLSVQTPSGGSGSNALSAYVQWRTYEDPAKDKIRGWFTLPQEMTFEDVADIRLEDADGIVIAGFASFVDSLNSYMMYDCTGEECISFITEESGYSLGLPSDTPSGAYTYVLTTTTGDVYRKSVFYQGQIELPVVASSSIFTQWDAGGNLTIEWDDPSWADARENDQIRVNVAPATFTKATIIVKVTPSQANTITIPFSIVDSVFDEIDKSWIKVSIQSRAVDDSGGNYARGISDTAEHRPVIIPVKFKPLNEVGTSAHAMSVPDAYAAIDFLTITADVTTNASAVTFTYETRSDFQNANTGMPNEYFALGVWFDRNRNDELDYEQNSGWVIDASLSIRQDLSAVLFGCGDSRVFTAKQEGNFVSVSIPWTELDSCEIFSDTPVRVWGHYRDDTIGGISPRFPNVW